MEDWEVFEPKLFQLCRGKVNGRRPWCNLARDPDNPPKMSTDPTTTSSLSPYAAARWFMTSSDSHWLMSSVWCWTEPAYMPVNAGSFSLELLC